MEAIKELETIPKTMVEVGDGKAYIDKVRITATALINEAAETAAAIKDDDSYELAIAVAKSIREKRDLIYEKMEEIIAPARKAWKGALALRDEATKPLDEALKGLRTEVARYKTEQERKVAIERERLRREEEERKDREAEAAAEEIRQHEAKERERKAKEEAQRRQEAQAKADRQAQASAKELAARRSKEEDSRIARAAEAEAAGDHKRAAEILDEATELEPARPIIAEPEPEPVAAIAAPEPEIELEPEEQPLPGTPDLLPAVPAPPPAAAVPKIAGVSHKRVWKARLTSPMQLLRAVVDGQVSVEAVKIHLPYLNAQAKKLKDKARIPGVEVYSEADVSIS